MTLLACGEGKLRYSVLPTSFYEPENVLTFWVGHVLVTDLSKSSTHRDLRHVKFGLQRKNRENPTDTRNRFDVMSTKAKQYPPKRKLLDTPTLTHSHTNTPTHLYTHTHTLPRTYVGRTFISGNVKVRGEKEKGSP